MYKEYTYVSHCLVVRNCYIQFLHCQMITKILTSIVWIKCQNLSNLFYYQRKPFSWDMQNRGEKKTIHHLSIFILLSATQKEIRIQLSWHYLMLDQKSQNVMPILYEKDYSNQQEKLLHLYLLCVHCLACLRGNKSTFIYFFIHFNLPLWLSVNIF
jgi:hypothetical protein